jgi:hypothetical protein
VHYSCVGRHPRRNLIPRYTKGDGSTMAESFLTALLQERASRQPDAAAHTLIDYEVDPNGFAESVTWVQVHRRAPVVATLDFWRHRRSTLSGFLTEPDLGVVRSFPTLSAIRSRSAMAVSGLRKGSTMSEPSLASLLLQRASRPGVIR